MSPLSISLVLLLLYSSHPVHNTTWTTRWKRQRNDCGGIVSSKIKHARCETINRKGKAIYSAVAMHHFPIPSVCGCAHLCATVLVIPKHKQRLLEQNQSWRVTVVQFVRVHVAFRRGASWHLRSPHLQHSKGLELMTPSQLELRSFVRKLLTTVRLINRADILLSSISKIGIVSHFAG